MALLQDIVDHTPGGVWSCHAFATHSQCEHTVSVDSLAMSHRGPRLSLQSLPAATRQRGRKETAPGHVPPRKQKAATMKAAAKPATACSHQEGSPILDMNRHDPFVPGVSALFTAEEKSYRDSCQSSAFLNHFLGVHLAKQCHTFGYKYLYRSANEPH